MTVNRSRTRLRVYLALLAVVAISALAAGAEWHSNSSEIERLLQEYPGLPISAVQPGAMDSFPIMERLFATAELNKMEWDAFISAPHNHAAQQQEIEQFLLPLLEQALSLENHTPLVRSGAPESVADKYFVAGITRLGQVLFAYGQVKPERAIRSLLALSICIGAAPFPVTVKAKTDLMDKAVKLGSSPSDLTGKCATDLAECLAHTLMESEAEAARNALAGCFDASAIDRFFFERLIADSARSTRRLTEAVRSLPNGVQMRVVPDDAPSFVKEAAEAIVALHPRLL